MTQAGWERTRTQWRLCYGLKVFLGALLVLTAQYIRNFLYILSIFSLAATCSSDSRYKDQINGTDDILH